MGVDFLQSFGVSRMIVDQAGTQIWVRWYKCQPGAKPFPNWTCFASPINENRKWPAEGPRVLFGGEQRPPTVSAYPGTHFEGDVEWFQTGLPGPPAAIVPPALCGVAVLGAQGGALVGGTGYGNRRLAVGGMTEATALIGTAVNPRQAVGGMTEATALTGTAFNPRQAVGGMTEATAITGNVFNPRQAIGGMTEATQLTGLPVNPRQAIGGMTEATSVTGSAGGPTNPLIFVNSCALIGTYTFWNLTVAGVSGSGACPTYNGTFNLNYVGGGNWESTQQWGTGQPIWQVNYVGGAPGTYFLSAFDSASNQVAYYTLADTAWACQGPNTLNRAFQSVCGFPSTLTITPA